MSKAKGKLNPRAQAAILLAPVIAHQGSFEGFSQQGEQADQALVSELCYGTLRYLPRLSLIAEILLKKPFKAKDSDIQALVYLGLYQLEYMRVPDHAAISETVQAAVQLKKAWAKGLLNAVLRNAQRQKNSLLQQLEQSPSFQTSHPTWLQQAIQHDWPNHAQEIFTAGNSRPPMTLRSNVNAQSRDEYLQQLKDVDDEALPCVYSHTGIRLAKPISVDQLPGFQHGAVSIQDEAAQWAASLLDLQDGQKVLDACAAPGGKSCHILETAKVELTALDQSEARLMRVEENLERIGISAELIPADAANTNSWWDGELFDRILLDAPCSGTGVIRRHPDIKWLRRKEDIAQFAEQQTRLLTELWPLLASGGLMVYATCSIMPEENYQQIVQFLKRTDNATEITIDGKWGITQPAGRQNLPSEHGADGFYYAVIQKQ